MPTVFTHPAIPLAIGLGLGKDVILTILLIAGVAVSVVPDLDVFASRSGNSYAYNFGHCAFIHSLLLAIILALLGACAFRIIRPASGVRSGFCFLLLSPMVCKNYLDR